jgi:hypothetical protein
VFEGHLSCAVGILKFIAEVSLLCFGVVSLEKEKAGETVGPAETCDGRNPADHQQLAARTRGRPARMDRPAARLVVAGLGDPISGVDRGQSWHHPCRLPLTLMTELLNGTFEVARTVTRQRLGYSINQ